MNKKEIQNLVSLQQNFKKLYSNISGLYGVCSDHVHLSLDYFLTKFDEFEIYERVGGATRYKAVKKYHEVKFEALISDKLLYHNNQTIIKEEAKNILENYREVKNE